MADYDTLAEMEYAFIVWRTNLKRDLSLTDDHEVRHRKFGVAQPRRRHALCMLQWAGKLQ